MCSVGRYQCHLGITSVLFLVHKSSFLRWCMKSEVVLFLVIIKREDSFRLPDALGHVTQVLLENISIKSLYFLYCHLGITSFLFLVHKKLILALGSVKRCYFLLSLSLLVMLRGLLDNVSIANPVFSALAFMICFSCPGIKVNSLTEA